MKLKQKILIILLLISWTTTIVALTTTITVKNNAPVKVIPNNLVDTVSFNPNYQAQIAELNKQIITLTMTVASTKESFYNSNIYLWTFIITALGLIIVVVGIFGYKSISDKIVELKGVNEKSVSKSEESIKGIKDDLIQRITEIKSDIKDFKAEQAKIYDKFEKDSKEKIDKGLDLSLQNAIDKIMKESFNKELSDLSEQVATLATKLENISSKEVAPILEAPKAPENNFEGELTLTSVIKSNNNAFDEQS